MNEPTAALERAELYFTAHPRSPSAFRRPRLAVRSGQWIAWLGRTVHEGISGFGPNVEAALRAFDKRYIAALRSPGAENVPALRAPIQTEFRHAR